MKILHYEISKSSLHYNHPYLIDNGGYSATISNDNIVRVGPQIGFGGYELFKF